MKKQGAAVWLFALLIVAFSSSPLRSGEVETVRFGVVFSLKGEFGSLGRMHLAGVRMRIEEINRDAEQNGFRLEMALRDDESDPALAVRAAEELLADSGVVAILGTSATSTCIPILPVVRDNGAVFITPSVTNDIVGKYRDGSFRVLPNDTFQGEALGRFLRERLNLGSAAVVVNDAYEYSRTIGRAFSQTFEAEEGSIVSSEYYDRAGGSGADFGTLLDNVMENGPEAIMAALYADDLLHMLREAKRKNVGVVFCGSDTWMEKAVSSLAAEAGAAAYFIGLGSLEADAPAMNRFRQALDSTEEENAEPGSMLGWDAVTLLAEGLRKGTSREALRENMYGLGDVELASGTITLDDDGIRKPTYIMKAFVRDGESVVELAEIARPDEPPDER